MKFPSSHLRETGLPFSWPEVPGLRSRCSRAQATFCWVRIFIARAPRILSLPGYMRPVAAACGGTAGTHIDLRGRCLALGRRLRWKLQSLNRGRVGETSDRSSTPPCRAACAKSSVLRPGETRGFPTLGVLAAATVGAVRQVWVARDLSQFPPRPGNQGCLCSYSEGLKAKQTTRTFLCRRKRGSQRGRCGNLLFRLKTTDSTFADLLSPSAPSIFLNHYHLSGCWQTAMTSF